MNKSGLSTMISGVLASFVTVLAFVGMAVCCLITPIPAVRFLEPKPGLGHRLMTGKLPSPEREPKPVAPAAYRRRLLKVRYS